MKIISLFLLLNISTCIMANAHNLNDDIDSIKNEMLSIEDDSLSNYSFEIGIKEQILNKIDAADSIYNRHPTSKEYHIIINNFKKLVLGLMSNTKIISGIGEHEIYYIDKDSLVKTNKMVCPLYPFCN